MNIKKYIRSTENKVKRSTNNNIINIILITYNKKLKF